MPATLVGEWEVDTERKKATKDGVSKKVSPVGNQSMILLGNSGSQSGIHTSKVSCLRGEGGGISVHQPLLDIG